MSGDLKHFQDRENAIEVFDQLWETDTPWILAFNGVAGQGKSTLLDWLEVNRCIAGSIRYVSLSIGDFSSSFPAFLARIAESMSAGFSSKNEEEFKHAYEKALEDLTHRTLQLAQNQILEGSPQSQQTMTANITEAVRLLENQSNSVIIEHWLKLVRTIGMDAKFVLLLDNYDVYQDLVSLNEIRTLWTILERVRQLVSGFRVVVASREVLLHQEHVESLRRGLGREALQDLSREDSKALLNSLGINDNDFCDAVYRLANGHPLITTMAAEAWKETPGGLHAKNVPNISGREKVVEWLQVYIIKRMDEVLRPAAQWTMLLRWFSFEILNSLLEIPLSDKQYRKLTDYAFIIPSKLVDGRKTGHDLVRKVLIAYLKREQKTNFLGSHKKVSPQLNVVSLPIVGPIEAGR